MNPQALARVVAIVEDAAIAAGVEALLPTGGRPRQLSARTLIIGMLGAHADGRPAHLTRVHDWLVALDDPDRRRLGVTVDWRGGPHTLTYRQVERTFGLVVAALSRTYGHPRLIPIQTPLGDNMAMHKMVGVRWSDSRPGIASEHRVCEADGCENVLSRYNTDLM